MQVVVHRKKGQQTRAMAGFAAVSLKTLGFNYEESDETVESFCESYTAVHPNEILMVCDLSLNPVTGKVCREFAGDLDRLAALLVEQDMDLCQASAEMLRQFFGES